MRPYPQDGQADRSPAPVTGNVLLARVANRMLIRRTWHYFILDPDERSPIRMR